MTKTVLYIATSLDGFIARPDGNLDWLTSVPAPSTGDYGYAAFLASVGTTIMGRKTYEEILGFGVEWPYDNLNTYVVTHNMATEIKTPHTYLVKSSLKDFVNELRAKTSKDIWVVGGGQLVTAFIDEDLLDKMIITIIPKIIGEGIRLFTAQPQETVWQLVASTAFETGVVNLTYEKTTIL